MIRITCTSCKAVLSIDDAFAGGVCRCQHCGTIQTVPSRLKGTGQDEQVAAAAQGSSKTLYQNKDRAGAAGSGLDDLAGIVASSGLNDSRLRKKPAPSAFQKNPMLLLAIAGGVIVLLLIALVVMWMHNGNTPAPVESGNTTPAAAPPSAFAPGGPGQVIESEPQTQTPGKPDQPNPPPAVPAGPNFCGVKLTSGTVVYLIDNGSSAEKYLDYVKSAVYNSAQSLGPKKNFEILFWNPQSVSFGPVSASPANIELAKTKLDDVIAAGSTDPLESLKKALAANPGEIVFITGKGLSIEDANTQAILDARGSSPVKIHVIDINGGDTDTAASNIAAKTGGTFSVISQNGLAGYSN